jgi:aminotransferase
MSTYAERFLPPRYQSGDASGRANADRDKLVKLAKEHPDPIELNSGDPDLTASPAAVDACVQALREGKTHYAMHGLPQLKAAIAAKLEKQNGFKVDPASQIIITNGSAECATAVFQTILEPGDEVLTTDPAYTGHAGAVSAARGVPMFVPTSGDDLWEPDPAEVEKRITKRTKAFIFANPGNPTGAVYRRDTLQALLALAHKHNILMIPDELFERFTYDGTRHTSMASLPGAENHVVTINGFSKSFCMTGWRLGYVVPPAWLAKTLYQVRYALSMCAGTPNQWGAVAALSDASKDYYDGVYRTYGERRSLFFQQFNEMGLTQRPAPGGFVGTLDVRATRRPAMEVAETFIRETGVVIWPATVFGKCGEGFMRISLIVDTDRIRELGRRLRPVVAKLLT